MKLLPVPPAAPGALPAPVLRNIPAPAKLNLFLHVTGRRADGYHLLQTVFRFIDLADVLHFERRGDGQVRRITPMPGVPEAECLTVRAARALQQATGCRFGVDIELEKHIPTGGGLGGGSSDAASVLLALNQLWGTGLSRAQLQQLALPLGVDVPVFVFGQSAYAEGVGEALQPLPLASHWYVVIQPSVHVATATVFGAEGLTRDTKPVRILDFPSPVAVLSGSDQAVVQEVEPTGSDDTVAEGFGYEFLSRFGKNDLESVVYAQFSEVALAKQVAAQAIRQSGGDPSTLVRMSGSGSCLFVECGTESQAASLKAEITATMRQSYEARDAIQAVTICRGLNRHPLHAWAA